MNIGKYIIERMNSGQWIVYWTDEISRYRNQVIIDNLEVIFDNVFKTPHETKKLELVNLFRDAMTNHDLFFENPMSHGMIDKMPNVNYFPGNLPNSKARFHWHLNQFIEAYAALTGTRFSPTELLPFLQNMENEF